MRLIFSPVKILLNGAPIEVKSAMLQLDSLWIDGREIPFTSLIAVREGHVLQCVAGTDTYEIHL